MQVIVSHVNADFDALASLIAAKKLYPDAQVVISNEQVIPVKQFLTIYRDTFDLVPDNMVNWSKVTELILVDVASLLRIGDHAGQLNSEEVKITIYDHHPDTAHNVESDYAVIEPVGAAVTLLVEEMIEQKVSISSFEATLFGLGIYADTGSFKYPNTTVRDFKIASFLLEQGMNLKIVQRFTDYKLTAAQQDLLNQLFHEMKVYHFDGLKVIVNSHKMEEYQMGLAMITNKLLDITGADAVLSVVQMNKHVYLVGRVNADRITLLPLLKKFGGGGHEEAGSAIVKHAELDSVYDQVLNNLNLLLKPAITAKDMMTSPVKTLPQETTIEEAGRLMYRYGHSGFPVVLNNELIGMATRRDLDKANHHDLGHAPIKAYMSTEVITVEPSKTIEEMQNLIIKHNIGRLPVIEDGKLIGIVTRTNIIEMLHNKKMIEELRKPEVKNLKKEMKKMLPEEIYSLLNDISKAAQRAACPVYLVGGIVRDLFLELPNDDIDIVVEGDGIHFLKQLENDFGGHITVHENFGTGTWRHPSGQIIDVTSARLEYYSHPASLPDVETSTLKEDLYRRDFTINSMAVSLSETHFGNLVDPFHGQDDIRKEKIRVLHNLSFIDDPTRILRAVRFEVRFNFLMDHQTENLVHHSIGRVKDLSKDRLLDQTKRLFEGGTPSEIIRRLFELKFWQQFGIDDKHKEQSQSHAEALENMYEENYSSKARWFNYFTIPFYDSERIYMAQQYSKTKQDAKLLQDIVNLSEEPRWKDVSNVGELQGFLKDYSDEAVLFIAAAEHLHNEKVIITYLKRRENLPSFLTGDDLIELGLKPDATFRKIFLK